MSDDTDAELLRRVQAMIEAGELADAVILLDDALLESPDDADRLQLRAAVDLRSGRPDEAIERLERVLELAPRHGPAHHNLAMALHRQARSEEALRHLRLAIEELPDPVPSLMAIALIQRDLSAADAMLDTARRLTRIAPMRAAVWNVYGDALLFAKLPDEAVWAYQMASRLEPDSASALNALGTAYQFAGRLRDAADAFRRSARLAPDNMNPVVNLYGVLLSSGNHEEAARLLGSVLSHDPHHIGAIRAAGVARLAEAPDRLAWEAYEARTQAMTVIPNMPVFQSEALVWEGADDPQTRLLVVAEQGFGDVFLFARYLREAARRVGTLSVVAPPATLSLMRGLPWLAEVVDNRDLEAYPDHDAWVFMGSLPLRLARYAPADVPTDEPWLVVPEVNLAHWRERLPDGETGVRRARVGLAWQGQARHLRNRCRSIDTAGLRPLLDAAPVDFYVLQPNQNVLPDAPDVHDLGPELADFADTAAALLRMDLVITVDTALANLAGALGVPFWVLLDVGPDWRWGKQAERTDWYPTARLFRQTTAFDWAPVIAEVTAALTDWLRSEGYATS
ncbi:MAG: tetratricopeptide repeat protein [Chromatiales bacterium]|nr:tetratricopeptide repeat protein [Gammaproteobacteria bacterium]MCP5351606.1 tetratricopeptide repeat protein [Chromatiales bacterium]